MDQSKKVKYPLTRIDGSKTEITLGNIWSEGLQQLHPGEEHEWLQEEFGQICDEHPNISRVAQGNLLRQRVWRIVGDDWVKKGEM